MTYRKDIDGLRAVAVVAVVFFHLGYLPNGYLGVDIFFVISGFLITSIIYSDLKRNDFSILDFYNRRIRRILPLLLCITSTALILGLLLMLPDDLENLAQSVVASNFSANNILMLLTSGDYWIVKNEYKPLMHTWSLGIEEQFYLIYPVLLLLIARVRLGLILPFLIGITVLSIALFLFCGTPADRFFLLPYRLFELTIGGVVAAILLIRKKDHPALKFMYPLAGMGILLCLGITIKNHQSLVLITTFLTAIMIYAGSFNSSGTRIFASLLSNSVIVFIGKISFSIYLWHHLIFSFARYAFVEKITFVLSLLLIALTLLLSIITYYLIEKPFRNRGLWSMKKVYTLLSIPFVLTTVAALYLYMVGGVYKDFEIIGLTTQDVEQQGYNFFSRSDNVHIHYNEIIRERDTPFEDSNKKKVLIIGDSYGRDVTNILLEYDHEQHTDLSYFDVERIHQDSTIINRWNNADLVILAASSNYDKNWVAQVGHRFTSSLDTEKLYVFGTKDFGYSNGIHFNKFNSINDYASYHAPMRKDVLIIEQQLKREWQEKYVSLIEPLLITQDEIRVFDDNGKLLSQDTFHLTKAGATYYATVLNDWLHEHLSD
ncbi:MAG: acyltransferase [Nonlabens sp.]